MKSCNLFVVVFDFKLHSLNADISRSQIRLLKADSRAQGGDSKPENEKCCRFSQSEQSKSANLDCTSKNLSTSNARFQKWQKCIEIRQLRGAPVLSCRLLALLVLAASAR